MSVVEKFVNRSGILEDVEALFGADVAKCVQGEDVDEDDLQLM